MRQVAGEKAQPLARLDGRSHQHDAPHLVGLQGFDCTGHSQVGLSRPGGSDPECQIACANVGKIVPLMRTAGPNAAPGYAHRVFAFLSSLGEGVPGLPLAQRQMNALRRHLFGLRHFKQFAQRVFSGFGTYTGHTERVAATPDADIEPRLQQPQVLIQRAAKIRESGVVRGLELEFALGFGC